MDQDSENGSQAESTVTEISIEPTNQQASSARPLTLEEFMSTHREENRGPARVGFLIRRRIPFREMTLEEFLVRTGTLPSNFAPHNNVARVRAVRAGTLPPNFALLNNVARLRAGGGGSGQMVEKRQQRMIRNRESAARSRSRKQAYAVELEAEVNQLREENELLKQALVEYERKRRQQIAEREKESEVLRAREKLPAVRRCSSCDY